MCQPGLSSGQEVITLNKQGESITWTKQIQGEIARKNTHPTQSREKTKTGCKTVTHKCKHTENREPNNKALTSDQTGRSPRHAGCTGLGGILKSSSRVKPSLGFTDWEVISPSSHSEHLPHRAGETEGGVQVLLAAPGVRGSSGKGVTSMEIIGRSKGETQQWHPQARDPPKPRCLREAESAFG